jgi:hypothetical protein
MQVGTYKIAEGNWEYLLKRIEKLTRRAKKLGLSTPVLTKIGEHEEIVDTKRKLSMVFYDITIESEPVCVAGWDFMATIELGDEEVGLIINRVPGMHPELDIPHEYRQTTNYCEHCHKNVRRNSVYILRHQESEAFTQVGRNCLGQFIGGVDPENIVKQLDMLTQIVDLTTGSADPGFFGFAGHQRSRLLINNKTR